VKPDNLIVKDGEVEALIDWEKAISGRPEWDLAYARIQMVYRWFDTERINTELEKELFRGYFSENDLERGWEKRLMFTSMVWNFKSMANFEKHFGDVDEQERQGEIDFLRNLSVRTFEDLEGTAEKEIKF
jgi:aminoglycoside phosphotransferase (APT) family kinase protein